MSKYYSSSIAFGAKQTKTEKVVVSPTKIGDVTTDAVSGALTVDEVPTLDSLNPVSSDGVARAVIQAGAELPTRGSSDTGKVLTVSNSAGDLEWDEPAEELPDMDGQAGKLLGAINNGGTMEAQWVNAPESYPSVTGNAGKVLKVNADATGVEWATDNTVTVDQTYSASSTNAQSGTAVAEAISGVNQVPTSTAADENKVLKVNAQGNPEWGTDNTVTVDQTYSASSTNPQSGTAVAGALANINQVPASTSADENKVLTVDSNGGTTWATPAQTTYTAGTGVDITSNVISADIDGSTIKTATVSSTLQEAMNLNSISGAYGSFRINADVKAKLTQNSSASGSKLKIHIPGNMFSYNGNVSSDNVNVEISNSEYFYPNNTARYSVALSVTFNSQTQKTYIDEQDIEISCYMADWLNNSSTASTLDPATSSSSTRWFMGFFRMQGTETSNQAYGASSSSLPPGYAVVISEEVASNKICVANPVPAFTSLDNGKVLGVVNGALAWVSLT